MNQTLVHMDITHCSINYPTTKKKSKHNIQKLVAMKINSMENIGHSKRLNHIQTTLNIYFSYCFHIPYFDCLALNGKV